MILNINGRRKQYTARGLLRMVCVRCKEYQAVEQWHLSPCILGNPDLWMPICLNCDCELNEMILRFWLLPAETIRALVQMYRAEMVERHGEPQRYYGV